MTQGKTLCCTRRRHRSGDSLHRGERSRRHSGESGAKAAPHDHQLRDYQRGFWCARPARCQAWTARAPGAHLQRDVGVHGLRSSEEDGATGED